MTGKKVKRMLAIVTAAVASACDSSSGGGSTGPTTVVAVDVTAPSPTLQVGEQMTLVATPRAADGKPLQRTVSWSSQREQIATVSSAGVVTGVAPGLVNILATSESRMGVVQLAVTPVPVAEVRLSVDDEILLEWDGTTHLTAMAFDAQGDELPGRTVEWRSSKPSVATVTQDGGVHAVSPGIASITAVIEGVPATVGVRVKRAPVVEVLLGVSPEAGALEVGETGSIETHLRLVSGEIVPGPMTWTSSNPTVATASSVAPLVATVEALGAGDVTLTATAEGVSASVNLRITPPPTHDLIYNRWDAQNASEIFLLSLGVAGSAPVRLNAGSVSRDPSPSPDGSQFVFAVTQVTPLGEQQNDLYIVNRNGQNMRRLTSDPGLEDQPAWSPDGSKILFRAIDAAGVQYALCTVNPDGTGLTKLTDALPAGVSAPRDPAWSSDGSRIAFTAARNGQHKIWIMNADGTNPTQLTTDAGFDVSPHWSPDGSRVAFSRYNVAAPENGWDVAIVLSTGGAAVRHAMLGDQHLPAWSPDGHYIAVTGTAVAGQGTQNLYTMRPDGTGLRLRTTNAAWGGGTAPAWVSRQ